MALNAKQLKQLKLAAKRRDRRPTPSVEIVSLQVKARERERFTMSHALILLAVEKAIQHVYQQNRAIDDDDVGRALACFIRNSEPQTERESQIFVALNLAAEESTEDRSLWQTAARIVLDSVNTHKDGSIGCQKYLSFASRFVDRARHRRGIS